MDAALAHLTLGFQRESADLVERRDRMTEAAWLALFVALLMKYHLAAYATSAGIDVTAMTSAQVDQVMQTVGVQATYAQGFAAALTASVAAKAAGKAGKGVAAKTVLATPLSTSATSPQIARTATLSVEKAVSRAQSYAGALKASYSQGATAQWKLPYYPADGLTPCGSHCRCGWRLDILPGEGNVDAYWDLHAAESCTGCIARSKVVIRIRGGVIV